jgi:hypothetical protein
VQAFHLGIGVAAVMVGAGGLLGLVGIRNPRRDVKCADCAEGAPGVQAPPLGRDEITARPARR